VESRFYGFTCFPLLIISTASVWHCKLGLAKKLLLRRVLLGNNPVLFSRGAGVSLLYAIKGAENQSGLCGSCPDSRFYGNLPKPHTESDRQESARWCASGIGTPRTSDSEHDRII
jgi:hypothetical protein